MTQFLVYYSLSGEMRVATSSTNEASEAVFAHLAGMVGKMGRAGLTANGARRVGLADAYVEIDAVEEINAQRREAHRVIADAIASLQTYRVADEVNIDLASDLADRLEELLDVLAA